MGGPLRINRLHLGVIVEEMVREALGEDGHKNFMEKQEEEEKTAENAKLFEAEDEIDVESEGDVDNDTQSDLEEESKDDYDAKLISLF
jgi:hypothetical protein